MKGFLLLTIDGGYFSKKKTVKEALIEYAKYVGCYDAVFEKVKDALTDEEFLEVVSRYGADGINCILPITDTPAYGKLSETFIFSITPEDEAF